MGGTFAPELSGLLDLLAAWPLGRRGGCWWVSRSRAGRMWALGRGLMKAQGKEKGTPACSPLAGWGLLVRLGREYSRKTLKHQEIIRTLGLFSSILLEVDCPEVLELGRAPQGAGDLGTWGPCWATRASVWSSVRI